MKPAVVALDNPVQGYAWGSKTAIAAFLDRPNPSNHPEAELWIGAHPKAPSRVAGDAGGTLDAIIATDAAAMLGPAVAARYGRLPFLLKILAAAEPLSIQCHPNAEQARAGFARENEAGLPLSAPERNYRDESHKPEILVALTRFFALKGFRPVDEILTQFHPLTAPSIEAPLRALSKRRDALGVREMFAALMALGPEARRGLVDRTASALQGRGGEVARWFARLRAKYPGDVGVLAPLFLNLVALEPWEALYLEAGELHAYLEGTGIELMANSDNVLRGGLTPKHVDVAELLAVARFDPGRPEVLTPVAVAPGERVYRTPAPEFELGLVDVSSPEPHVSPKGRGVELLLGLEGEATVAGEDVRVPLGRGRAAFVPAAVASYRIEGMGRICRARVGPIKDAAP